MRETADQQERRHRRVRAEHRKKLVALEQAEAAARDEYGYSCAKVVLGEGDESAVREVEAEVDRLAAAVRRARAADHYLSPA
ncbi:MAG: hypothetical protein AB1726_10100 [Planctomycetota bacterium]